MFQTLEIEVHVERVHGLRRYLKTEQGNEENTDHVRLLAFDYVFMKSK